MTWNPHDKQEMGKLQTMVLEQVMEQLGGPKKLLQCLIREGLVEEEDLAAMLAPRWCVYPTFIYSKNQRPVL